MKESDLKFTTDWVTNQTEHWEAALEKFKGEPYIKGLEVGTWEGRSAHWFATNITSHKSSTLVSVDRTLSRAARNIPILKEIHGPRLQFVEFDAFGYLAASRSASARRDLHFIYLDCAKDSAEFFPIIGLAWNLLRPGGVLIFDDYQWPGAAAFNPEDPPRHYANPPRVAISAFLQCFYDRIKVIHHGWQVIVQKTR